MDKVYGKVRNLDAYPRINEDFFSRTLSGGVITLVSSNIILVLFVSEFTPMRAPKWYKSKAGVSFGFGGKLVSFHSMETSNRSSEVYLSNLVTEHALVSRSSEFEAAIRNGDRSALKLLCDRKSQESDSVEDREIWGFMKVVFTEDGTARSKLLSHLGFSRPSEASDAVQNDVSEQVDSLRIDDGMPDQGGVLGNKDSLLTSTENEEDFFNNLASPKTDTPSSTSKKEFIIEEPVKESKQEMDKQSESFDPSFDDTVHRALIVGDYKGAVAQCISANRLADALVIAHVGGGSLWERTRDQFLKNSHSPYLKVVSAMVNNDLMSIANTRPLKSWKETLALFCTVIMIIMFMEVLMVDFAGLKVHITRGPTLVFRTSLRLTILSYVKDIFTTFIYFMRDF